MNSFLLDTHTFLWSLNAEEKLGDTPRELLSMPENPVYVSSVTFWEISLKTALRKLTLENYSPDELPAIAGNIMGYQILPLEAQEAATFYQLPLIHRDPFDRMLIWQAISTKLILVAKDSEFTAYAKYGLQTVW